MSFFISLQPVHVEKPLLSQVIVRYPLFGATIPTAPARDDAEHYNLTPVDMSVIDRMGADVIMRQIYTSFIFPC